MRVFPILCIENLLVHPEERNQAYKKGFLVTQGAISSAVAQDARVSALLTA